MASYQYRPGRSDNGVQPLIQNWGVGHFLQLLFVYQPKRGGAIQYR